MARGALPPAYTPRGGHRGALYVGDFHRVCKRAAYQPSFRFVYNPQGVQHGAPAHCCGMVTGFWSSRQELADLPQWLGPKGNVAMPFVPEFTIVEDIDDPGSEVYAIGWRTLLKRWISCKVLRPTDEIMELLGPDSAP